MPESQDERSGFFPALLLGFSGFTWLVQRPAAWPAASVPILVWVLLSAAGVGASVHWLLPWLITALPQWSGAVSSFAAWGLTLLASAAGMWLSLLLTPPLSSPALERLVRHVELDQGVPPHPPLGLLSEFSCGLRATLVGVLLVTPIIVLALLLDMLAPALAPIWLAIKLLASAFGMSWGLLDYPLTLRGMPVGARLALMRRHAGAVIGFGLGMLPFFWLPCCLFVSLPVGVVAATLLAAKLRKEAQPPTAMPS